MDFCPKSYTLLEEITSGDKLKFKSNKTGTIYDASPEHTMLYIEEISELESILKYKKTLTTTAFDPINPRIRYPGGCGKCGRKVISYQQFGENKKVQYACICGEHWSN